MKKTRRLATRLTTSFILAVIVPLIIAGTVFGVGFAQFSQQTVQSRQASIVEIGQGYIESFFNNLLRDENLAAGFVAQGDPRWVGSVQALCERSANTYLSLAIVNMEGDEVARLDNCKVAQTSSLINRSSEEAFFKAKRGETFIGNVSFDTENRPVSIISVRSTTNDGGNVVVIAQVDLENIWTALNAVNIGDGGYLFVVDQRGNLIGYRDLAVIKQERNLAFMPSVAPILVGKSGVTTARYSGLLGEDVIGTSRSIPQLNWGLVLEQPTTQVYATRNTLAIVLLAILVGFAFIAAIIAIFTSRSIVTPIEKLATAANSISAGDLNIQVEAQSNDEIGTLANTFNRMTQQLRDFIATLEQRVVERTQALANVADISTIASNIQNEQEMLATMVHLVQRRFGLYHAHVFTYHEGQDDLQIVACGYKEGDEHEGTHGTTTIPLAQEQSLVARAARTKQPVIVNDVRSDPGWLPNPLLPDTAAELAVPLLIGDKLIGVLDVQSDRVNAFTESDADIQMTLGAQIAVATQNIEARETVAKRAAELQNVAIISTITSGIQNEQEMLANAVHLVQRRFGLYHAHVFTYHEEQDELQIVACGYKEGDEHEGTHGTATIPLTQEQSLVARAGRTQEAVIVNDVRSDPGWLPNPLLPDTAAELAVPLIVGNRLIGVLDVQSDHINAFTQEDASIQTTLASQIAVALQNTRSLTETQHEAERETLLNTITQKIQSTTDIKAALQITARELGHALGMKPTLVTLEPSVLGDNGKTSTDE